MNTLIRTPNRALQKKKKSKRRFITLLELLIVMGILALTATVVTVNIRSLMSSQRFYSAVELVTNKLQTAQDIMLIFNSDTIVTFKKTNGSWLCRVESEKALPPHLKDLIRDMKITGIDSITFDANNSGLVVLKFSAINSSTPEGILKFSADDDTFVQYITLQGHAHPIETTPLPQPIEDMQNDSASLYPKKVREMWQDKIKK